MMSECVECDKIAIRYWGRYAYCKVHFEIAKLNYPGVHECILCQKEQPPQVMWRGDAPCKSCQEKAK